jgi:hypothetical protein
VDEEMKYLFPILFVLLLATSSPAVTITEEEGLESPMLIYCPKGAKEFRECEDARKDMREALTYGLTFGNGQLDLCETAGTSCPHTKKAIRLINKQLIKLEP